MGLQRDDVYLHTLQTSPSQDISEDTWSCLGERKLKIILIA